MDLIARLKSCCIPALGVLMLLLLGLTRTARSQETDKPVNPTAYAARLRALEQKVVEQQHAHDMILKRIDDLMWHEELCDIADIQRIRDTGPKRYEPNPTAQDAGNPLIVYAYSFIPRKLDRTNKYPLLVFPHGGVHDNFNTRYETVVRELLEQGYVLIASDYRGSTGYGAGYYNQIDYGGAEIEDVYLAGRWMLNLNPAS